MSDITCEGVTRSYGQRQVLRNVELHVPSGTMTVILGSSGSGKTTLIRLIAGFEPPDTGTISIGGRKVSGPKRVLVPPEFRSVGYVPQEGALFPHLNIAQNIGFGLTKQDKKAGKRVQELINLVGLDATYLKRRPSELSGGEQRRIAVARALAPGPGLIVLDEPFSGLDAALRLETRIAVRTVLQEVGTTAILVTHDQAEALSIADQVAVLNNGIIVQTGTPQQVYESPVDLESSLFVGESSCLDGKWSGSGVETDIGAFPWNGGSFPEESGVVVVIRPEKIHVKSSGIEGMLQGKVLASLYFGSVRLIEIELLKHAHIHLFGRLPGTEQIATGDIVGLTIDGPSAVFAAATT